MTPAATLQSLIAGRWLGERPAQTLPNAVNGEAVAFTHEEPIDFAEALAYARGRGARGLRAFDFQGRASRLRALASYLVEHKESLYALSLATGATRNDGWIDIEGGFGTLFAYASLAANELPSGNVF